MDEVSQNTTKQTSWAKRGMAAALAAVLAVLVGQEFFVASTESSPDPGPARPKQKESLAPQNSNDRPPVRIPIETALEHDPFQLPTAILAQIDAQRQQEQPTSEESPAKEAKNQDDERSRQALIRLRQDGIKMIVETDRGRAALVGDRIVHEGDNIDGFRVVRITKDGIDLERDNNQP